MRVLIHIFGLSITSVMSQMYLRFRVRSRSKSPINFRPSFQLRKLPLSRNGRPTGLCLLYKSQGDRRLGRLGGRGKKHSSKNGTARKGDTARSKLCLSLLRPRQNAWLPVRSHAVGIGKESGRSRVASASRFGPASSRVGSLLLQR